MFWTELDGWIGMETCLSFLPLSEVKSCQIGMDSDLLLADDLGLNSQ
jgi:hypothetical protein